MIEKGQTFVPQTENREDEEAELNFIMRRVRERIAQKAKLRDERFRKMLHEAIVSAAKR